MFLQLAILVVSLSGALSSSSGASTLACTDLTPRHGQNTPQTSEMPVDITVSLPHVIIAGDVVTLTLSRPNGLTFRGFIIQARILGSGQGRNSQIISSKLSNLEFHYSDWKF